ncbi:MAG: hypothetical protein JOY66_12590, partial [Acetobacteraceae bacterium]|nr:hypothetical protein [Acetobacteraceae bacterium]
LDRLGSAREVAQTGAVIGREFTRELLGAVAGQSDAVLEQSLRQLVQSELLFRSGVPPVTRYAFKHALVQQAAYESLPRSRRAALHARIAEVLVALDPGLEATQPDLLAWHCEQAGLIEAAVSHRASAAWRSASRGAYAEARGQCASALRLIATLPDGSRRDRMSLEVLACLSEAIVLQRGYANREAVDVQVRAQELWERLGRPVEFVGVIRDRWQFHFTRSETGLAQELADKLLQSSRRQADPRYTVWGHTLAGGSALVRGELLEAIRHLQEGLRLMRSCSEDPSSLWRDHKTPRGPWTAWAHLTTRLGYAKCWLGYPDQALACLSSVIERAPQMGWEPARVVYSILRVQIGSFFTDGAGLAQATKALSKRISELDLALYKAMATIYQGHVVSCCEDPEGGIAVMQRGMEAYHASGTVIWSGHYHALLAEAYQRVGRLHEARRLLAEAQHLAGRTGERWYDAELARRLGELDRQQGDTSAAERRLQQALATARRQHARLWELHAATSLARLWHGQRRSAEARAVLAPVYGWFGEGLQTASLRSAKVLLDELDQGTGQIFQQGYHQDPFRTCS